MVHDERQSSPLLHIGIAGSLALVLMSDLYSPLGVAVWVFYFVPVVLSFWGWRPWAPFAVAGISTVLLLVGYLLSPPGITPIVAQLNRSFALITLWVLSGIGSLFVTAKIALRTQEWIQSGRVLLGERLAGELSVPEISAKTLRFFAEYLDIQVSAMFVDDDGAFVRAATHAALAADLPSRIAFGEGLVGQAVADGQMVAVDDVREGHLRVVSALGTSMPRHLVIAPFSAQGHVHAVVEFAVLQPLPAASRRLVDQAGELVAVALRSAQYRSALQNLLEETQRQAEELQAQGEQLREQNDELEAQRVALTDSQVRLEEQQAELEQTNAHLEEQTQILQFQRDELGRSKDLLETQARELAVASRYKSEFLANMSHELRTPLNATLILARLLAENRQGTMTPEQVRYATTIESSGNDLLALINDVLDLAKVEAGHLTITPQPVPIASVMESLAATFRPIATEKGLRFETHIGGDVPESFETDPLRLEQILRNLLSNAVKFTDAGAVSMDVRRDDGGGLAFAVSDTGTGIAPESISRIFEPFVQANGSATRNHGGTGLGLSICRELSRLLGGSIAVDSTPGLGSTFILRIPERYDAGLIPPATPDMSPGLGVPQRRRGGASGTPGTSGTETAAPRAVTDDRDHLDAGQRCLLIVEDDEAFASILTELAHEQRFQAVVATTSAEALRLAVAYPPAAVVLDIGLPDSSGLTVLDRLKADPHTRHIPVHIVSVHDYAHTALSLGAVGYALKPVKREQLVEALRNLDARLTRTTRRVLIVEDDLVQREALTTLIASDGVEAVCVGDVAATLELLRSTTFDCMVLDLGLPDGSGFSLLETISREEKYAFPPVIVYTGRELAPDDEQRLRRYSRSIIVKGARSPERLLDEVTLFLHQVIADLPPSQQQLLAAARRRDSVLDGRRVLLVEDDVRNVFALSSALEPTGLQVRLARNGREALDIFEQGGPDRLLPVDLVLMDLMMPEMDGLTAIRHLRARPQCRTLPIIALTAKATREDREQALAAGASDYLPKPFEVEQLISLIRIWLPR